MDATAATDDRACTQEADTTHYLGTDTGWIGSSDAGKRDEGAQHHVHAGTQADQRVSSQSCGLALALSFPANHDAADHGCTDANEHVDDAEVAGEGVELERKIEHKKVRSCTLRVAAHVEQAV